MPLQPSGNALLCIDAKHAGIGSDSCGPALAKQYQIWEKELAMRFWLEPAQRAGGNEHE